MKIYISGQITGLDNRVAFDNFEKVEKMLLSQGHDVVNPMKLKHKDNATWCDYMREDIKALCDCDAIYLQPNWYNSRGAKLEFRVAASLNLIIFEL